MLHKQHLNTIPLIEATTIEQQPETGAQGPGLAHSNGPLAAS